MFHLYPPVVTRKRQWRYILDEFLCAKGELREFTDLFRKIPLHQQKTLMVSVFSNSPWLPRNLKDVQNKITKRFSVSNTFLQATMQARIFVSIV